MERAVTMLLQEKQLSNFSPLYFEFSRFSDGSKLNRSPLCRHSLRNDGAKISILLERCNIVSRFFHFGGKISAKRPFPQVLFCPFQRKWKKSWYLAAAFAPIRGIRENGQGNQGESAVLRGRKAVPPQFIAAAKNIHSGRQKHS